MTSDDESGSGHQGARYLVLDVGGSGIKYATLAAVCLAALRIPSRSQLPSTGRTGTGTGRAPTRLMASSALGYVG